MSNFSFTTVADALNGVVDGTAAANKAVVLDANSKISGLITTNLKVDDSDAGVVITSADQTHASPVVTIPDIADAADTFVVADAAQTLTNKTLTTPKIVTGGSITDAGGDEYIKFTEATTPVTYIGITSGDTGVAPQVRGAGETNTDLKLAGTGTGNVIIADGADITKELSVELVGATTDKTMTIISSQTDDRALTLPDVTDTLVGLTATQTLTNKTLTSPKINEDVALTATATQLNEAGSKASSACRLYNLGAPSLASVNSLVTSTNMIVGEYTIDGSQPDVPRNVTVSATAGDTADTMGTITFVGTNYADEAITEEITPVAGSTVAGTKAFKTVTTITGADWIIDGSEGTNDTITIGIGNEIGLPIALDSATEIMMGILGTAIVTTNPTVGTPATIEETTIDVSSGIYDGTKEILVFVVD